MGDRLPKPLRKALAAFGSFTAGQKAVTIAAVLALAVGGYFFATWASTPAYAMLFNNLSGKDASAVVESLQASGTPYELENNGATIMVPADKVNDLRIQLSGEGLPAEADSGYALLDEQGITTSDFMQHVGYQRALEGELSKTIKSIDGVEAATVHLVIPQKDVFSDDENKPTASVLVASQGSSGLSNQQVQAIVHLVASSVEGLEPAAVTVAGADGKVLSSGDGTAVVSGDGDARSQATNAYQNKLNTQLQLMLDKIVGPGNTVVTSTVDLDFDQTQTQSETFSSDPNTAPLAESNKSETYNGAGGPNAGGALGPDNIQNPAAGANGSGQYLSSESTKNNAVNKVIETRKNAGGNVRQQSVSVLLNSRTAGNVQAADVQQLVAAAAGIDAARGDTIAVSAMPFDTSAEQARKDALAQAGAAEQQDAMMGYIRIGAMAFVVLVLLFLAWRASKRNKRSQLTEAELAQLEEMQAALERQRQLELAGGGLTALEAAPGPTADDEAREARQKEIAQMVQDQPDEVAALLRGWLAERR
ncbi:flagellar basal-body MS-ring/collar protein FliF [Spirilliplanes yamanashiensis]|uniref:Flagellar M-ring protein n=1 Tax=Spirilliplanes yamanashiensis TaxID=42233 RepID=A0A8J3Y5Q5_9ACTN|nr:flagellar basal-body MS-ring/collar protein FliF [Spirilliplanes yamanashiensis]MDP9814377.1 flagellar M-ring protein FliF [Spirilliplanes yamanashiensis]GIJ02030.1 flagellar M-ring protein [Spirilliplanes yamanashiensis]